MDGGTYAREIDIAALPHIRPRHYGRMAAVAAVLVLFALLVRAFVYADIDWGVVHQYLAWPSILRGAVVTVAIALASMAIGIVLGVIAAVARTAPNPVLRAASAVYVWLFRGAPVILQLLLWYNLALIFPTLGIPGLWQARTVVVMTPVVATLLGLGLNEGAYVSEIIRAGMISVDTGQYEAAKSIGMTFMLSLRRIILPQAMRVVIPPLGNEFISLTKTSSLASVIGFNELLHSAQYIYFTNTKVMELLIVATVWYLVIVSVLSLLQALIERRFARGVIGRR
jgi:polar amino acid transport system permease protein